MTNADLIRMVKRQLDESWKREERLVRHGSAYGVRLAEYDGAVKALSMLAKNLDKPTQEPTQTELL